jgi:hypothetical protein
MPEQIERAFELNYPQWQALQVLGPRRTLFLGWGRGVGKSWMVRFLWWKLVAEWDYKIRTDALKPFRGVRINVLMPTLTQFKDVHWAGIEQELGPGGDWEHLHGKLDRSRGHITFPGGSLVRPFPATAYNARTARGMRTDVLCCDEFDDTEAEVYDGIAGPWLSEPWSLGYEILTGTPTRGRHGLWWRTMEAGRQGAKLRAGDTIEDVGPEQAEAYKSIYSFHATYVDAPETVSPQAVAKAKATIPRSTFEREWEANPDAGEGLVYPFMEAHHVRPAPALSVCNEFLVGMDHGWVDPGAMLLGGIQGHGNDATLWFLDEFYESECPNHIWDDRAFEWYRTPEYHLPTFWPDPSRPDRIDSLRARGIRIGKTDNDIAGGIARVADMLFIREAESGLRFSRLYISPKCKNLIREFGLYRRKKLPGGGFSEIPEDKNNHLLDCARYLCVGRFGRGPNYRHTAAGR